MLSLFEFIKLFGTCLVWKKITDFWLSIIETAKYEIPSPIFLLYIYSHIQEWLFSKCRSKMSIWLYILILILIFLNFRSSLRAKYYLMEMGTFVFSFEEQGIGVSTAVYGYIMGTDGCSTRLNLLSPISDCHIPLLAQ